MNSKDEFDTMDKAKELNVTHFLYHAGFVNDDGGWDSRMIFEQTDNFQRLVALVVMECERVVCNKFDETEPWMYPGDLMKHFGIHKGVKNDNY